MYARNVSFKVDCATKWRLRVHSKSLVKTLTHLNTFKKHFITIDKCWTFFISNVLKCIQVCLITKTYWSKGIKQGVPFLPVLSGVINIPIFRPWRQPASCRYFRSSSFVHTPSWIISESKGLLNILTSTFVLGISVIILQWEFPYWVTEIYMSNKKMYSKISIYRVQISPEFSQ